MSPKSSPSETRSSLPSGGAIQNRAYGLRHKTGWSKDPKSPSARSRCAIGKTRPAPQPCRLRRAGARPGGGQSAVFYDGDMLWAAALSPSARGKARALCIFRSAPVSICSKNLFTGRFEDGEEEDDDKNEHRPNVILDARPDRPRDGPAEIVDGVGKRPQRF